MFQVLMGILCVMGGAALIWKREILSRWNASAQRAAFGNIARRTANSSTPRAVGAMGIFTIVVGLGLMARGFLQ